MRGDPYEFLVTKTKNEYLRAMRYQLYLVLLIVYMIGQPLPSYGQVNVKDSVIFSPLIDFSYSFQIPGGDLAQRFGNHSEIGVSFLIKTHKNFLYGVDWNYLFGDEVKEDSIADGFRDEYGGILANNGLYSQVYFTERGFSLSAKFGKIFSVLSPNPNSGIMVLVGVGILQHKIKIEDRFNEVPLLSGDNYYAGYDRLTNGVMFTEFIGYRLLSTRRLINVFGGFEFSQALTKNRREVNFDTGLKDSHQRHDLQMGVKIGFTLPLYKQVPQDYYYR